MISFMKTIKMTDRSVVATCLLGSARPGTGLSGAQAARLSERPIEAPAVAAAAAANAYAFAAEAANGAGSRTKQQHQHKKWALRRLEPWSYPA
ncbi:hypothetical protein HUT19_13745 [Streptomyces sp. NA02950]|uniref:hypothetical protein n=1 Tax=Streptomyces sp. NA02950 TaxID=2742137 RepID=UPI00158FEC87|nr:hypothetical protein [Streptomyces sp. NA02950]QKV92681.1 hypothetical protein HUT19_13745 [Streptomyces sp. NA02950]